MVEAILNMSRNTISFSRLEIINILNSQSTIHIGFYITVSIALFLSFIYVTAINTLYISKLLSSTITPYILQAGLPPLICLGCLQINALFFPNSMHAYSTLIEISKLHIISYLLILFFITGLLAKPIALLFQLTRLKVKKILIFVTGTSILLSIYSTSSEEIASPPSQKNKNVILISIDSFRKDHMHDHMPFLTEKLNNSLVFSNSFTPFARTFPSWSTILSGQYPAKHGARYNLIDELLLNPTSDYLPQILNKNGYETIYASDERRFSQIGHYHGFKQIIGPRTGLANLVLGQYGDFPLTNLLTLTPLGEMLMPDITLNRAASNIYSPSNFSDSLNQSINESLKYRKPVFLSVHYCMPHWPFNHGRELKHFIETDEATPGYHESLKTVDKQISSLWKNLEENNLISNSIIVFLSDHGETWNEETTFKGKNNDVVLKSNGHGSNVISDMEHRVLTAFYHPKKYPPTDNKKVITLADIKPTILSLLNISDSNSDGRDIFKNADNSILFPVESGFKISAITHKNIDINKAIEQSVSRYTTKPDGTIRLKIQEIPFLNQGKRVGVRNESQLLTYQVLPNSDTPEMFLLNYKNKTITKISRDEAKINKFAIELCKEYKDFIDSKGYCK